MKKGALIFLFLGAVLSFIFFLSFASAANYKIVYAYTYDNNDFPTPSYANLRDANIPTCVDVVYLDLYHNALTAADLAGANLFVFGDYPVVAGTDIDHIRHPSDAEKQILKDAFENGLNITFDGDNGQYMETRGNSDASFGTRDFLNYITPELQYPDVVDYVDNENPFCPDYSLYPFLTGHCFSFQVLGGWNSPGRIILPSGSSASCVIRAGVGRLCRAAYLPNQNGHGFIFVNANGGYRSYVYLANILSMTGAANNANLRTPAASSYCSGTSFNQYNGCGEFVGIASGTTTCSTGYTCLENLCNQIITPTWTNTINSPISSAQAGDTVLLKASGIDLSGKTITYTIVKPGYISWNPYNWFSHTIRQTTTEGYSDWIIAPTDSGTFYFTTAVTGVSGTQQSGNLVVSSSISNSMPVALITAPSNNYNTSANCSVSLTQASYDVDDFLNLSWKFGDGASSSVYTGYSITSAASLANTNHLYANGGLYNLELTAAEMARGQIAKAYRSLVVFEKGINVIPIITSPENGSSEEEWVNFDASQSYVVNCSADMPNYDFAVCSGALKCKYIHRPGKVSINTSSEHYDLAVNWTVKDIAGNVQMTKNGWWSTNYDGTTGAVIFDGHFPQVGTHYTKLNIDYFPK